MFNVNALSPSLRGGGLQGLGEKEFVLGTRYGEGFDVDPSWPWYRSVPLINLWIYLLTAPRRPRASVHVCTRT